jgi:hypothetical protein
MSKACIVGAQGTDGGAPMQSTLSTFRLEEMDEVVEAAHSKTKKGKTVVTFD